MIRSFNYSKVNKLLRCSTIGVAVAVFFFSLFFRQTSHILMWMNIPGAIYAGAGAVIIGGLYWDRSTTAGAYGSLLVGASVSVCGIIIKQFDPEFFINEQYMAFIAMISALVCFVIISFLTSRRPFNMDKLLHRGQYALSEDQAVAPTKKLGVILHRLGITNEFTFTDKLIYLYITTWSFGWFGVFVIGTIYNIFNKAEISSWNIFWRYWVIINTFCGACAVIWLTWGGFKNFKELFVNPNNIKRDESDNGIAV